MGTTFGPISESEVDLLMRGLSRLQSVTPAKDGTITIGPAESQFTTAMTTIEQTIKALGKVLPNDQFDVFGPVFERKALRCCTGYLKQLIFSLTTRTLPEYDRRVAKEKDPLMKTKYMQYLIEAKVKLELATKLLNRMERSL